jgi:glycerol-3-phosphate acyltransferase PlsY
LRAPRIFLGDRYSSFFGFAGSKDLSWLPLLLFFRVCGLQEPFLATVTPLFSGLRAPRTFLGDRYSSFFGFAGSKDLSWRPLLLFLEVCGLQEPFLATVTPLFSALRAPRTFLGDRYTSFFGFAGSKNLSWRPLLLFLEVCGLQEPFLATVTPLFSALRAPRTFLGDR